MRETLYAINTVCGPLAVLLVFGAEDNTAENSYVSCFRNLRRKSPSTTLRTETSTTLDVEIEKCINGHINRRITTTEVTFLNYGT